MIAGQVEKLISSDSPLTVTLDVLMSQECLQFVPSKKQQLQSFTPRTNIWALNMFPCFYCLTNKKLISYNATSSNQDQQFERQVFYVFLNNPHSILGLYIFCCKILLSTAQHVMFLKYQVLFTRLSYCLGNTVKYKQTINILAAVKYRVNTEWKIKE